MATRRGAPQLAPASPPPPYLDAQTPPLTRSSELLLLLSLPLAVARLAGLFLGIAAYYAFLLLLQRPPGGDADRPRFRLYPLVVRVSFAFTRFSLALCGFALRVRGSEHVAAAYASRTASVCVANHVSMFDVFTVAAAIGPFHPVSRVDVARVPLVGRVLTLWGFTGVDRSAGSAGVTAAMAARARRTGAWQSHPPLLVFPEGTCTTGDALLRFKSGAFVAGAPVLPLAVRYDAGPLCVAWVWRDDAAPGSRLLRALPAELLHLLRVMAQRRKTITVTVLPPHAPSDAERADPALFAEHVRQRIAAALAVPLDDRGVEDARTFYSSRIAGYSASA